MKSRHPTMNISKIVQVSVALFAAGLLLSACDKTEKTEKNIKPIADAGKDMSVKRGAKVTLDGSASSDANGDQLRYSWSQTAGTPVELQFANSATPSFIAPDDDQPLEFALEVNDGKLNSKPDAVSIYFLRTPPPTVTTGAQIVAQHNQKVELTASLHNDVNGDTKVQWRQTYGKRVHLENADTLKASFIAPEQSGILIFEIGASNKDGGTNYDSIAVHVTNKPPLAVAKTEFTQVGPGDTIALDGSGSSDPDGDKLIYRWKQVLGSPVAIDDPGQARISFAAPDQNDHLVFTLNVSDGEYSSHLSRVHVKVKPLLPDVATMDLEQAPTLKDPGKPITWMEGHDMPSPEHENHWSYKGDTGPQHWGSLKPEFALCEQGDSQSPIDITNARTLTANPIEFHYQQSKLNLVNNGHTIRLNYDPGSFIVHNGNRYELLQFHFHVPSEHAIDGKRSDMVAHLVHQARDGQLAVVALLFEEGKNNDVLETIWESMPNDEGNVTKETTINVEELLPKNRRYYHYNGSLTTPPCSENVSWNILTAPSPVSAEQLSQFKQLFPMNARPLQALNDRRIFQR